MKSKFIFYHYFSIPCMPEDGAQIENFKSIQTKLFNNSQKKIACEVQTKQRGSCLDILVGSNSMHVFGCLCYEVGFLCLMIENKRKEKLFT